MTAVTILLPHGARTGGPEALLQLADSLNRQRPDLTTRVLYYTGAAIAQLRALPTRLHGLHRELLFPLRENEFDEYRCYTAATTRRIPHDEAHLVVVPEVLADLVSLFPQNRALVWWLSVDNAFSPLSRTNFNYLRRPGVFHACQSAYAERFLAAAGITSLGRMSDYTSELFDGKALQLDRRPLVAINANFKVVVDLEKLEDKIKAQIPEVEIRRISGLAREEVLTLLGDAKVYLDLGNFPGKDRLPREAARLGCAVVLADAGAGHTDADFDLPEACRLNPWDFDGIAQQCAALLRRTDVTEVVGPLQAQVARERELFDAEVRAIFAEIDSRSESIVRQPSPIALAGPVLELDGGVIASPPLPDDASPQAVAPPNDGLAPLPALAPTSRLQNRARPYYILSLGSPRQSRTTHEAHLLCHALNVAGHEAYLFATETLPALRTPTLTGEIETRHRQAGLTPIVIYAASEIADNPLDADVYAYFRNAPGAIPLAPELTFATASEWLPSGAPEDQVVVVPRVDTTVFNNSGASLRHGILICCDGYPDALEHFADFINQGTLISETSLPTPEAFASQFRGAERFYAFGDTPLALEAALCGCPVVFIAAPGRARPAGVLGMGSGGVAFADDAEDLSRAMETVGEVQDRYQQATSGFWTQLNLLVTRTQAVRLPPAAEQIYEEDSESLLQRWVSMQCAPSRTSDEPYARWRRNRYVGEIDAQLFAERMVLKWTTKPQFRLIVELRPGEEHLLADTLDSLSRQLYDRWHLTVISRVASDQTPAEEADQISWIYGDPAQSTAEIVRQISIEDSKGWVAFIEPGVRLEPHSLFLFADYAALHPEWSFIYSDEDLVSPRGDLFDPNFKPDFNLDMLRSMHYLGSLCMVRHDAWGEIDGLGTLEGAENYDLALRVLDCRGAQAIGHIAEVLYHTPANSRRAISPANEQAALIAHLARGGVPARVQDGHGFATHRVIYEWPDKPLVSVIISTRDKPEYIGACLDTLFARTTYPSVELVILDNGTTDPEALKLLESLEEGESRWPVRIVRDDSTFNYGALCNTGARHAQGEYLLFLDNDTAIIQEDWLDRLMASAQRAEIGMTAPRLGVPGSARIQSSGYVLGLRGVAAGPYDNLLRIDDPGYQGRATVDQNVSAVSGACMLVRRSIFDEIGGFNPTDFPVEHATLDLCLRLTTSGHLISWTPYVTVAHYGRVTRGDPEKDTEATTARILASQKETTALLDRWLPRLANDPFYNRHLSLAAANHLEADATITWDTNFHDRLRLIGFPVPGGSGEYRIIQPFQAISHAGLAQTCIVRPQNRVCRILSTVEMARAAPDAIIVHQSIDATLQRALEAYRTYLPNAVRIMGLDDLITLLPPRHPSFRQRSVDARSRLRALLALCDRAVVSTQPLADLCADLIEDVRVMPNCLDWGIWGTLEATWNPQPKPRVGWIGAQQHYGDLEHIFEVVAALAGEVDWVFMGMCPKPIRPFVKEFHPWATGFEAYSAKMASLNLDLAIAPLDVNAFNEAKSNLRLLEYGVMRWPVVCTDIYPYQDAPVTRVPNSKQAWINAIREKLSDRQAARREGELLRSWVEANFILENRAGEWLSAFGAK